MKHIISVQNKYIPDRLNRTRGHWGIIGLLLYDVCHAILQNRLSAIVASINKCIKGPTNPRPPHVLGGGGIWDTHTHPFHTKPNRLWYVSFIIKYEEMCFGKSPFVIYQFENGINCRLAGRFVQLKMDMNSNLTNNLICNGCDRRRVEKKNTSYELE